MMSLLSTVMALFVKKVKHIKSKKKMSYQEKITQAFERFVGLNELYQTADGELFAQLPDAQAYAMSLLSATIVTINRPTGSQPEALPNAGKWIFMPNGAASNGMENLIVNGYGELGDKTNFSKFGLGVFETPAFNYKQGFVYDGQAMITTDSLIPIDVSNFYELQLAIKIHAGEINGDDVLSIGLQLHDQDGALIEGANYVEHSNHVQAKLKFDLLHGASIIELEDGNTLPWYMGNDASLRCIALMNYQFKNGKKTEDYTRNVIKNAYMSPAEAVGSGTVHYGYHSQSGYNSIHLRTPYQGDTVPAGTIIKATQDTGPLKMDMYGHPLDDIGDANSETQKLRWFYGGDYGYAIKNAVNFTNFAKFAKLYVDPNTVQYLRFEIAGVSLKIVPRGSNVNPVSTSVAYPFDGCYIPSGMNCIDYSQNPPKVLVSIGEGTNGNNWIVLDTLRRIKGDGTTN